MWIHVGFYDEIRPLLGPGGCEQESCPYQKHAIRHGRDRATGRHRRGTAGTGIVQQQPTATACAESQPHRLRSTQPFNTE